MRAMWTRRRVAAIAFAAGITAALCAVAPGWFAADVEGNGPPRGVAAPDGWTFVWSDEFDGVAVDRKRWTFDIGTGRGGWGNRELQFYTDRPENAFVRDGMLHVRAVREAQEGAAFTSARLKTKGQFSKKFGRFEVRAKLPVGKGVWPAVWMLPDENHYGGWPASGEIDLVEARGQEPGKVLGTLHYGAPHAFRGKNYVLPGGGTIADFHVYGLEWEPGEIRWSVDGTVYQTQNFWWSATRRRGGRARGEDGPAAAPINPWPAPFDRTFHLLVNVAVGGNFLGNPDADTTFPVEMVVDYVRVYDRAEGYGEAKARGNGKVPGQ